MLMNKRNLKSYLKDICRLLLLVACVGASPLGAQVVSPMTCVTSGSAVPQLRSEGLTELVGDIVLVCSGGVPTPSGKPIPQGNISILLNTLVTSRILANGGSEALLLIDEPAPSQQLLCSGQNGGSLSGCTVLGTGGSTNPFNGADPAHPNIFQGVVSGNSVTFAGVPIDPPGPLQKRTYRITNIRANASSINPSAAFPGQIFASVSSSGLPIANFQQSVGIVMSGLSFVSGGINIPQCSAPTSDQLGILQYTENFPTAFKPRLPAAGSASESGFMFPGLPQAGLADAGTRFKAVFNNIPAGINIFVSTTNVGSPASCSASGFGSCAQLIASETGAYAPVASTTSYLFIPVVQLSLLNGSATAVWEVASSNPAVIDTYSFAVFFLPASTGPLNLSLNTVATVNGSLAPIPPLFSIIDGGKAQPATFPVPRFLDTSTPATVLSVSTCQTTLLFPFVVAQSGFDTGLAISNTSADPFGTTPQAGACTLNFYSAGSVSSIVTTPVASGTTFVALASTLTANFQGYLIAQCNFQFAHGFATISDIGARTISTSYLGLVLPDPPRAGSSGETLVH